MIDKVDGAVEILRDIRELLQNKFGTSTPPVECKTCTGTPESKILFCPLCTHGTGQAKVVEKECEHNWNSKGAEWTCSKCGKKDNMKAKPASLEEVIEKWNSGKQNYAYNLDLAVAIKDWIAEKISEVVRTGLYKDLSALQDLKDRICK